MAKKILITSIPSWNQKTGSNTFSALFDSFDSNDLANIYVSGDMPDSDVCSRYYHIDEMSVVKSVFNRGIKTGEEIYINSSAAVATNIKKKPIKRTRFKLWAREIAWKLGCWKSKELNTFLNDFHPNVLVFPIESYPYFNRLNKYIVKHCRPAKVIGYLWDDNFTYKQYPNSWIAKIERYFLRRQVKQLIGSCTDVLAISSKMKDECDAEFGTDCVIITKPIFNLCKFEPIVTGGSPVKILYTGKLIIGREYTVVKIVAALKELNKYGQKAVLDVYTNTVLPDELRRQIDEPGCCILHDAVPQSEVAILQREADVLLFVESLSDDDLTARLSFSTKLTDYFAAGKCVWAVGNRDLGPISYIKDEDAGLVSYDEKSIKEVLQAIVGNPYLVNDCARKGYECGKRNHNGEMIIRRLKDIIGYDK